MTGRHRLHPTRQQSMTATGELQLLMLAVVHVLVVLVESLLDQLLVLRHIGISPTAASTMDILAFAVVHVLDPAARHRMHRRTIFVVVGHATIGMMNGMTAMLVVMNNRPVVLAVLDVHDVVAVRVHVMRRAAMRHVVVHRRSIVVVVRHMAIVVVHRHPAMGVVLDRHSLAVFDVGDLMPVGMVMRMHLTALGIVMRRAFQRL